MVTLLQNLGIRGWRDKEVQQRATEQLEAVFRKEVDACMCSLGWDLVAWFQVRFFKAALEMTYLCGARSD